MYREHRPPRELEDVVEAFWTHSVRAPREGVVSRIVPDGCIDVIVHLAGRPRVEVVGTMTRALLVPEAVTEIVAVRLRPGAARVLLKDAPADALTDTRAPLDVLGLDATPLLDALQASSDVNTRVRRLAAALVAGRRREVDALVDRAARWLASPAPPSVADLADRLGITRQTLARRVREAVGVGPKVLARVLRFQRAARALRAGRTDHAALASELGFVDQAHFVREIRELSGLTPGAYARRREGSISTIPAGAGVANDGAEELP